MTHELLLNNYGVQEMHTDEMREIDGGFWGLILAFFILGVFMGAAAG